MWHWLAELKLPGGVFGLEDGADWLLERATARKVGIPYGDVGACRLHDHQQVALQEWMGQAHRVLEDRLFIHESPAIDFPDLLSTARQWVRAGARWIVIDHGLRIRYQASGSRERLDLTIGNAMNALADFGIKAGVPVVLCWHLNRDSEEEAPPKRSDFKESGYLDAAARTMLGLWKQKDRPGSVLTTVVKCTKGEEGATFALERDAPHGLIHSTGGYEVDFAAEAEAARRAKEHQRAETKPRRALFDEGART
jgi:replicative DNA helicase